MAYRLQYLQAEFLLSMYAHASAAIAITFSHKFYILLYNPELK